AGCEESGGVLYWTDQPYSDPRRSPRACLNRQAGFSAARPAANWIPSSTATWKMPTHSLAVSGRLCVDRRVVEEFRQDADCGLEEWSGCFRPFVARKTGRATRGSEPEEDRAAQAQKHWIRIPVSNMVPIPRLPVLKQLGRCRRRSGVRLTAGLGHDDGANRETNRPRHRDRRSRASC